MLVFENCKVLGILCKLFCDTYWLNESRNVVAVKYRLIELITTNSCRVNQEKAFRLRLLRKPRFSERKIKEGWQKH
jgi:hypothetical protein